MIGTVFVVGAVTYWDETRRSASALEDLGGAQAAIARAAGLAIGEDLGTAILAAKVDAKLRELELDGARVLVLPPGGTRARMLDGRLVEVPGFVDAAARGDRVLRLSRTDASELGLPARTAMIGIARLASGWSVGVAASAERQRDRELGGLYRTLLAMALAVGVVTAFGGIALARQRMQLELAREL
ncbi:MAG TPA: hypothetical protein VMJ10_20505, partial [Kofleriaceae bacterium]|nr:hypothetical protein [Kofleriaceae bacterium]